MTPHQLSEKNSEKKKNSKELIFCVIKLSEN